MFQVPKFDNKKYEERRIVCMVEYFFLKTFSFKFVKITNLRFKLKI